MVQCGTPASARISGMALPRFRPLFPAAACTLAAALLLAGCAAPPPAPGTARTELLQRWGVPTGIHTLPEGGERLEYATGPYGRTTWMIDLDAGGRVQRARQVLEPATMFAVPAGLTREALRRELGRPGEVQGVWRGGEVWSWRYETNDCLWFRATITPEGRYAGGALMPDPLCEARDARE